MDHATGPPLQGNERGGYMVDQLLLPLKCSISMRGLCPIPGMVCGLYCSWLLPSSFLFNCCSVAQCVQHYNSKTSVLQIKAFLMVQPSHPYPTRWSIHCTIIYWAPKRCQAQWKHRAPSERIRLLVWKVPGGYSQPAWLLSLCFSKSDPENCHRSITRELVNDRTQFPTTNLSIHEQNPQGDSSTQVSSGSSAWDWELLVGPELVGWIVCLLTVVVVVYLWV